MPSVCNHSCSYSPGVIPGAPVGLVPQLGSSEWATPRVLSVPARPRQNEHAVCAAGTLPISGTSASTPSARLGVVPPGFNMNRYTVLSLTTVEVAVLSVVRLVAQFRRGVLVGQLTVTCIAKRRSSPAVGFVGQ
ncbi:hypothetical protein MRX96_022597 [Rhipicephalus microplus]